MSSPLTARDLLPLLEKLPPEEQLRLAKWAYRAATGAQESDAYRAMPPTPDEFSSEEDPLAWEGEGWDAFRAPR